MVEVDEPKPLGMSAELLDLSLPPLDQTIDPGLEFVGPIGLFIGKSFEAMNQVLDLATDILGEPINEGQEATRLRQSESAWTENLDDVQKNPPETGSRLRPEVPRSLKGIWP